MKKKMTEILLCIAVYIRVNYFKVGKTTNFRLCANRNVESLEFCLPSKNDFTLRRLRTKTERSRIFSALSRKISHKTNPSSVLLNRKLQARLLSTIKSQKSFFIRHPGCIFTTRITFDQTSSYNQEACWNVACCLVGPLLSIICPRRQIQVRVDLCAPSPPLFVREFTKPRRRWQIVFSYGKQFWKEKITLKIVKPLD